MFVVRLVGLLLLTLFCYAMGTIPSSEANAIAKLFGPLFFVAAPALYFLPTIEAKIRSHNNLGSLAALNFFLGWTIIGWVSALVWALAKPARAEMASTTPGSEPLRHNDAAIRTQERDCPHCAEVIKAAAKVCKHCGRDVEPQPAPIAEPPADHQALANAINAARRARDHG